jgi:phosphohistidine phosphatase SixA
VAVKVLIRHAHSGSRDRWEGDDRLRPLSKKGWRQARALERALADVDVRRVLSSPYVRCVQTVQPLAEARGLAIEETDDLAEGAGLDPALRLIRELAGTPAALCTHGDIMAVVCQHLVERSIIGPKEVRYDKGAAWLLEEKNGELVSARYLPARAV